MRVAHHAAALVVTTALGGLLLATQISRRAAQIEQESMRIGVVSRATRDIEGLRAAADSYLIIHDLLLGGESTYLVTVAKHGADRIRLLLDELRASRLEGQLGETLQSVRRHLDELEAVHRQLFSGPRVTEEEALDAWTRANESSRALVEGVQSSSLRCGEVATTARGELARRKEEALHQDWIEGILYLVLIGAMWRWTVRRLLLPIEDLSARVARGDESLNGLTGPKELNAIIEHVADLGRAKDVLEQAVRQRTRDLELATHAKSEFLASMSHEIRTPLTAVIGFADLLRQPTVSASERTEFVERIHESGQHLLGLINQILELSKIEAGKIELKPSIVDPAHEVAEAARFLEEQARARDITLDIVIAEGLPATVRLDGLRLRQVVLNLVGNAVKFTPRGAVTVRLSARPETPSRQLLELVVVDTGIGISAEGCARLFQPFVQIDSGVRRRFEGTGLGLAITRRLVELLGGTIELTSEVGVGSTFRVLLPVDTSLPGPDRALPSPDAPMPSVRPLLLVDDNPINRRLIGVYLKRMGFAFVEAENGAVACGVVERALLERQPVPLVLLDMMMPIMDGYEAARRMRAMGHRGPILALTANALAEDRERCLDCGCDEHCAKPIDPPRFQEFVRSLLTRGEGAGQLAAAT